MVWISAEPEPFKMEPPRAAVIVVDMQNAFVSYGGYFDLIGVNVAAARKIIQPCRRIIEIARVAGITVVYLRTSLDEGSLNSLGTTSPRIYKSQAIRLLCERPEVRDKLYVRGAWGEEVIKELKPEHGDINLVKQTYDGFIATELDSLLRSLKVKYLVFVGIAANICVESTLRHAFDLGYFPLLVSDAVAAIGPEECQKATAWNTTRSFGWVTNSTELLAGLGEYLRGG